MKFTEKQLKLYAAPLSESENQKCKNAIGMVRDALKPLGFTDNGHPISLLYEDTLAYAIEMKSTYGSRKIKLFIQGSYANNTNVRTQSDVDIAVVQEEIFQTVYREGVSDSNYNFSPAKPAEKTFKDEVEECLKNKFGRDVERKNKSIKVHGNTYRKDADTVPCRRYRDYRQDFYNDENNYIGGIVIIADNGERIINYPEQHIANGRTKNAETNYYYKKMVRIIKKMRYIMDDNSYPSAKKVSSFGLESLLWNLPNEIFTKYFAYRYIFDNIVDYIYNNKSLLSTYKEANGIKPLCPCSSDISKMSNFINDLKRFYEYDITED